MADNEVATPANVNIEPIAQSGAPPGKLLPNSDNTNNSNVQVEETNMSEIKTMVQEDAQLSDGTCSNDHHEGDSGMEDVPPSCHVLNTDCNKTGTVNDETMTPVTSVGEEEAHICDIPAPVIAEKEDHTTVADHDSDTSQVAKDTAENASVVEHMPVDEHKAESNDVTTTRDSNRLEDKPNTNSAEKIMICDENNTAQESEKTAVIGEAIAVADMPSAVTADTTSTAQPQPATSSLDNSADSSQSVYHVKWIEFKSSKVPVVTQNENGPCPLIAIINVLLLKKKIVLPPMMELITSDQLMSYLGDCIFENAPKNITEGNRLNYEQNMHDAMAVFHKLQTGLDVNVRFTGVQDFEYTSETIIFDLLEMVVYHGWLVDPQADAPLLSAISNCSYNGLVEKIITQKASDNEALVTDALLAETFLETSASQLTYHGLCELWSTVKEDELCVFFRNNHFSTLHRYKNELFLLVTDQGFLTEPSVVWETLSNVEGDCHFVDAIFHTYTKPEVSNVPIINSDVLPGSDLQIDQDYLVALSLQQEQADQQTEWGQRPATTERPLDDRELALRLQEEENRRVSDQYHHQQGGQPHPAEHSPRGGTPYGATGGTSGGASGGASSSSKRQKDKSKDKDKDSCVIL